MRVLIENATVVTMNDRDEVLKPGWIDIRDGAITAVSSTPLPGEGAERRIDGFRNSLAKKRDSFFDDPNTSPRNLGPTRVRTNESLLHRMLATGTGISYPRPSCHGLHLLLTHATQPRAKASFSLRKLDEGP